MTVVDLRERLLGGLRMIRPADEPVAVLRKILQRLDRLAVVCLAEALSLFAVSDVMKNFFALDREELLVDKFDVQRVAEPVIRHRRNPRKPVQKAFPELAVSLLHAFVLYQPPGSGGEGNLHPPPMRGVSAQPNISCSRTASTGTSPE